MVDATDRLGDGEMDGDPNGVGDGLGDRDGVGAVAFTKPHVAATALVGVWVRTTFSIPRQPEVPTIVVATAIIAPWTVCTTQDKVDIQG